MPHFHCAGFARVPDRFAAGRRADLAALATLILWVLVLGSCASDSGPKRPAGGGSEQAIGGGSLFEQLEAKRQQQHQQARKTQDLAAGAARLPDGWRQKMDGWWPLFWKNDPAWPEARTQWVALGPAAANILVENLIRAYVVAFDAGDGPTYYRAREELAAFKDQAIPYLVEGLASGYGDDVVRNLCGELLAYLGDSAVPAVEQAWGGAAHEGRRALARALKKMQCRASGPLLIRIAGGRDPFDVRIEAIETLGRMGIREAVPVMRDGLKDSDVSVRKFSAIWISALGDGSAPVLESLVSAMERAISESEGDVARACRGSLRRLCGRDLGASPGPWFDAIRSGAIGRSPASGPGEGR